MKFNHFLVAVGLSITLAVSAVSCGGCSMRPYEPVYAPVPAAPAPVVVQQPPVIIHRTAPVVVVRQRPVVVVRRRW